MTYNEIISRALGRLAVIQTGETPDGNMYLDGIHALNDMVNGWRNKGVYLNFNTVADASGGNSISFDDEDIAAIVDNLAIRFAPDYGKQPSPFVVGSASSGWNALYQKYASEIKMSVDDAILPSGMGTWRVVKSSILTG